MSDLIDRHAELHGAAHPRRASAHDAAVLARLLTSAFLGDPVFDWIARKGPKRARGLERFFYWLLKARAIPFGETWMAEDGVAAAVWLPPGVPPTTGSLFEQLTLMPLFVRLCGIPRLGRATAMAASMERHHPKVPHYYLAFVAVAPRLQGLGLGSAILEATLERADAHGWPAYLENSNPRNTRLYARHGFVAQGNIAPRNAPPLISMWREARAAAMPARLARQGSSSLSQ